MYLKSRHAGSTAVPYSTYSVVLVDEIAERSAMADEIMAAIMAEMRGFRATQAANWMPKCTWCFSYGSG